MNKLLAIETSSEACSVALAVGDEILERHDHAPLQHAERLLPAVGELLAEAEQTLHGLGAIVYGRGPGSFTSLRIGIGAVQGLAWGAGVPVVPVSSLAGVAAQCASAGFPEVLVAVDARMNEVFAGHFRFRAGLPEAVGRERVCPPAEVIAGNPAETVGCGNGFERYDELRQLRARLGAVFPDRVPRASALIPLARSWLRDNEALPAHEAQPVYVRDHVADKPRPAD